MLRFVQVNLLGSVVSSCLLIPGICFVARGLSNPRDKLNKHTGAMASLVLLLASLAYCVTTAFNVTTHSHRKHERECAVYCDDEPVLGISRLVALVLPSQSTTSSTVKRPLRISSRTPSTQLASSHSLT